MELLVFLAFFSCIMILYPYLIYPVILLAISHLKNGKKKDSSMLIHSLKVTFLISVHNAENYIKAKLENILELDGFHRFYEIIVVSDLSTDRTDEIVLDMGHPSVRLIRSPSRIGKTNAENYALSYVTGDIIIFTDASTPFQKDSLVQLLKHFSNPKVGCVSTEDVILTQNQSASEEGLYVKFEMWLRRMESELGILGGVSGSGYACRRELAINIPGHLTRDLHVPLFAREKGMLSLSEPCAKCYVLTQEDVVKEFQRKVRTFTGGIATMFYMLHVLNPLKYGGLAVSFINHKLIRWLGPFFLLLLFCTTAMLSLHSIFFAIFFYLQMVMYIYTFARFAGFIKLNKKSPLNMLFFFILTNIAACLSWLNYFFGKKFVVWEPTKR